MTDPWLNDANAWAATWGEAIARATWQGALFVVALWVLCRWKRIPASTQYWLWWLACLQLMIRVVILTPFALPILPAQQQPQAAVPAPIALAPPELPAATTLFQVQPTKVQTQPVEAEPPLAAPLAPKIPPSPTLYVMAAWMAGVLVGIGAAARRLFRTHRLLRSATQIVLPGEPRNAHPPVKESPLAPCPLLAGWVRPTIVLPANAKFAMTPAELRMAVAHEQAHHHRRDLWFAVVPAVAQIVLFFNPLVWLAAHELSAACEEACDVEALRTTGGTPAAYARLLLVSSQADSSLAAMGAAFSYKLLRRRIKMVNESTRAVTPRHRRISLMLVALCAVCALPWSVTAQSAPAHTGQPKHQKKAALKRKTKARRVAKATTSRRVNGLTRVTTSVTITTQSRPVFAPATTVKSGGAIPAYPTPAPRVYGLAVAPQAAPAAAIAATPAAPAPAALGSNPPMPSAAAVAAAPSMAVNPANVGLTTATASANPAAATPQVNGTMPALPTPHFEVSTSTSTITLPPATVNDMVRAFTAPRHQTISEIVREHPLTYTLVTDFAPPATNGVSVSFQHENLESALTKLFQSTGASFALGSGVRSDRITCTLNGVPLKAAIDTIIKLTKQRLTYTVEHGIYIIKPAR